MLSRLEMSSKILTFLNLPIKDNLLVIRDYQVEETLKKYRSNLVSEKT
jgi:hypothetical protein